jgi:hypothetical protein
MSGNIRMSFIGQHALSFPRLQFYWQMLGICMELMAREKLVSERGAGSGERGAGISSPIFLEF